MTMDILISSLISVVVGLLLVLIYRLFSDDADTTPISCVKYRRYPIVGHLFSFFGDRANFMVNCRQRYGRCFTIKLLSERISFVLSPADWTTVARNQSIGFPGDEFSRTLFGMDHNAFGKSEMDSILHRYYLQYLKNSDGLQPIVFVFVQRLRAHMMREKASLKSSYNKSQWMTSGLLELSHRLVFQPLCLTLFGEIDPLLLESDYRLFDSKIHYFFALLPQWIYSLFFRRVLEARSRLNNSWLKNPHPPHESDFVRARASLITDHPEWFSEKDYCCEQTLLLFGSLSNTIPAVFWCLLYILRDVQAVKAIKQEIDENLSCFSLDDDAGDLLSEDWTLDRLDSCNYLDSAVNETIRLVATPMVLRKCLQATQIVLKDGRILNLKSNDGVALFPGAALTDADIFSDPTSFVFDRFFQKNADAVFGFMPFGMGKSICPGRFLVRYVMKMCVVLFLQHVEYKLVDTVTIPAQQSHRVGLGVAPPSQDVRIAYRYKNIQCDSDEIKTENTSDLL